MEETKIIFETTDKNEANLMLNATRMAKVLSDFLDWHSAIYNYKDIEGKILFRGQVFTQDEFHKFLIEKEAEIERDERGLLKENFEHIYLSKDVEQKLDALLDDVKDLIFNYFE